MRRSLIAVLCAAGLTMLAGEIRVALFPESFLAAQDAPAQGAGPTGTGVASESAGKVSTYTDVATVVAKYHCAVCHGGAEPRAGLSLDDYKSMMKGGKHGPVIVPGSPEKSELIRRLQGMSEPRMPYTGPPWLSDAEVATIEQWIAAGARE